jgi:UDP-N-acetylglucosamine:LPS N-acetylglucosamine transferase
VILKSSSETIALEIACWLQESHLLDDMSRKAMKVGHPHAAEEIALDIGETAHAWMERNAMKRKNKQ